MTTFESIHTFLPFFSPFIKTHPLSSQVLPFDPSIKRTLIYEHPPLSKSSIENHEIDKLGGVLQGPWD
jgi:hypothetical protein